MTGYRLPPLINSNRNDIIKTPWDNNDNGENNCPPQFLGNIKRYTQRKSTPNVNSINLSKNNIQHIVYKPYYENKKSITPLKNKTEIEVSNSLQNNGISQLIKNSFINSANVFFISKKIQ